MADDGLLTAALVESQRLGMLGARPIGDVIAHADAFVDALGPVHGRVVDLGTGGGIPGLVIAARRPDLHLVLVDRRATRADHVARLVRRFGWGDRVEVRAADADTLIAAGDRFDGVVARSFGPPAVTLTTAAALLAPGGRAVVSEPPPDTPRQWDDEVLRRLGLTQIRTSASPVAIFTHVSRETSR